MDSQQLVAIVLRLYLLVVVGVVFVALRLMLAVVVPEVFEL